MSFLEFVGPDKLLAWGTLAMSSTSRGAIAAASGITSLQRMGTLFKTADAIGLNGIVRV